MNTQRGHALLKRETSVPRPASPDSGRGKASL